MRLSEIDPDKITPGSKHQLGIDIDPYVDPEEDETGRNPHERKADMVAEYIDQHCGDILSLYKANGNRVFYRGLKTWPQGMDPAFVGQSREDRQPKDSDNDQTRLFDAALASSGFKALRSNSLFVSSSISVANDYGKAWVIFPLDGFDFTYTNRRDLVIEYWSLVYYPPELIPVMENWLPSLDPDSLTAKAMSANIESAKEYSDKSKWDNGDNVFNYSEAMLRLLKEALHVYNSSGRSDKNFEKLIGSRTQVKNFIDPPRVVMEYFRPKKTDLDVALVDGREVFLRCKYVAVKEEYFTKVIAKKIGLR